MRFKNTTINEFRELYMGYLNKSIEIDELHMVGLDICCEILQKTSKGVKKLIKNENLNHLIHNGEIMMELEYLLNIDFITTQSKKLDKINSYTYDDFFKFLSLKSLTNGERLETMKITYDMLSEFLVSLMNIDSSILYEFDFKLINIQRCVNHYPYKDFIEKFDKKIETLFSKIIKSYRYEISDNDVKKKITVNNRNYTSNTKSPHTVKTHIRKQPYGSRKNPQYREIIIESFEKGVKVG